MKNEDPGMTEEQADRGWWIIPFLVLGGFIGLVVYGLWSA
jgi:hypothetical protein